MHADFFIIANPVSGSQTAPDAAARAKALLEERGAGVELAVTAGRGDAQRLAGKALEAGVRRIVACGGDGTLQEIAAAMECGESMLGILPFGCCNNFARALGFRRADPLENLTAVLTSGNAKAVDIGAFGDQRFLTVATLGFDSEVSRFVKERKMWLKGTPSYMYGVLRVLLRFRPPRVRIEGDFGSFEGRILLAATGNTPCYGGAINIAPGAKLDDGLFDVCLVEEVPGTTVLRMLPRVMRGTHIEHPSVRLLKTKTLSIESLDTPQWICADGETLGQTPGVLELRPGALRVLVP